MPTGSGVEGPGARRWASKLRTIRISVVFEAQLPFEFIQVAGAQVLEMAFEQLNGGSDARVV